MWLSSEPGVEAVHTWWCGSCGCVECMVCSSRSRPSAMMTMCSREGHLAVQAEVEGLLQCGSSDAACSWPPACSAGAYGTCWQPACCGVWHLQVTRCRCRLCWCLYPVPLSHGVVCKHCSCDEAGWWPACDGQGGVHEKIARTHSATPSCCQDLLAVHCDGTIAASERKKPEVTADRI